MGGVGRWDRNTYFQLAVVRAGYKPPAITAFTPDNSSPPTKQQAAAAGQSSGESSLLDLFNLISFYFTEGKDAAYQRT